MKLLILKKQLNKRTKKLKSNLQYNIKILINLKINIMKIISELNLQSFQFWSGAKEHNFTYSELESLEYSLEDLYPEGCSETTINDLFWFEEEFLCECIGINFENDYLNR